MSALPLHGIRVVALEQAVAAPFCSRQLADMGADVIKMEAASAGIALIVCITEGIPVLDMTATMLVVREHGVRLIGPNGIVNLVAEWGNVREEVHETKHPSSELPRLSLPI